MLAGCGSAASAAARTAAFSTCILRAWARNFAFWIRRGLGFCLVVAVEGGGRWGLGSVLFSGLAFVVDAATGGL